jgi:hypothetical protein
MPPNDFERLLELAPLRVAIAVPDDLMEDWFAPDTGMNPISPAAIQAAREYADRFECEFKYYPDRLEGVFWKWVPAI